MKTKFTDSRPKLILYGAILGFIISLLATLISNLATGSITAIGIVISVSLALEIKDYQYLKVFDIQDFIAMVIGGGIGLVINLLFNVIY